MSDRLIGLAEILERLNSRWSPHPIQAQIGHALFYKGVKNIFVCAARNFGKTELSSYALWRWAAENPGSENYIILPLAVQGREILWASERLQRFGPWDWIEGINSTEMRITFRNGSFIKVTGSDNAAALAGIKPKGLIVYDEVADHREQSIKNMEPNRAAFDSPALFVGSPPEFDCYYVELMELAKRSPHWKFFHAPTSANPHISREWLRRKKEEMVDSGDEEGWLRSYEGIYVKGGKKHIFPQFLKYKPKPLPDLLPKDINKWWLVTHFDPASTSVFGVLFSLYNPHNKRLILVDEVYEGVMENMTTRGIWSQVTPIVKKWEKMGVRKFEYGYDEAAAWFANETADYMAQLKYRPDEKPPDAWLQATQKHEFGVESGIGLVRDVFSHRQIEIADHLEKTIWELENYIKDDKGRIPKKNDHQINNLQYTLQLLGYDFAQEEPEKEKDPLDLPRAVSLEDDIDAEGYFDLTEGGIYE